jgi:pantoate--beta-alanine ligase
MSARPVVVDTIAEVRAAVKAARGAGHVIGLVPTMGALHAGHGHLVEKARAGAGFVVVSIFVNPTQFGPSEDFAKYPRTLEADRDLCGQAGANLLFVPAEAEMYPRGGLSTFVEVDGLSSILEGASRPGHFRGVATVVTKLFQIVQPDRAWFGQKDYQQLQVIRRMVADLDMPVEIIGVPTVREADGLAMSSRNRYLSAAERAAAVVLSRALERARALVAAGERDATRVRQAIAETVESEALARLDTVEIADAATLDPIDRLQPGRSAVALLAARVGPGRLIDNILLVPSGQD